MASIFDEPKNVMTSANNIGEGWHDLVRELEADLTAMGVEWEILQVKEKFGGLRYYARLTSQPEDFDEALFWNRVHRAEGESYEICEKCGTRENVTNAGRWIVTLCATHRAERQKAQDEMWKKEDSGE